MYLVEKYKIKEAFVEIPEKIGTKPVIELQNTFESYKPQINESLYEDSAALQAEYKQTVLNEIERMRQEHEQ